MMSAAVSASSCLHRMSDGPCIAEKTWTEWASTNPPTSPRIDLSAGFQTSLGQTFEKRHGWLKATGPLSSRRRRGLITAGYAQGFRRPAHAQRSEAESER